MSVALSQASKLSCRSWSLQALETCPGSRKSDGSLVDACTGCYATSGNYRFKNVIEPRERNRHDWQRDEWVDDMVQALDNDRYFRWFDSGDIYHPKLAEKIYYVMLRTPWVKHWIPGRSYKLTKIKPWLEKMKQLPNVSVRYSSDSVLGEYTEGFHGSVIIPTADFPTTAFVCGAYKRDGKCGPCRACWDKSIPTIAYPGHGRKMLALIKRLLAKRAKKAS